MSDRMEQQTLMPDGPIPPERVTLAIEGWNAGDLGGRAIFDRCLTSLLAQTYPIRKCEVLIIVDARLSDDELEWLTGKFPEAKVVRLADSTYYRVKNLAIASATRDVLVFADSDVRYTDVWLAELLNCVAAGAPLVVGNTQFEPGPFSRTLNLTDWAGSRIGSGPTEWLYANNLAMRRELSQGLEFRTDMGKGGEGGPHVLRHMLKKRAILPWFCEAARGWHYMAPFWQKRLRLGAYLIFTRRNAPELKWSWLARVPVVSPFLVAAGSLVNTYRRVWRLRRTLPWGGLSLPVYVISIAMVKSVELLGALLMIYAPGWIQRRYGWFDIPAVPSDRAPAMA
jgi:glycosyltransferase involved in cell wall biosynthesis